MAWQLLAAALPAAAKVAGTALSKPKEEDFKPQTDYMKKYLSFLRGRTADREVAHMAMQPALRVAGKQGRQAQRQVGYDVTKSGLGGSGIEAQMRLSAGQQTQDALATATDKAVAAQTAETARIGEKAAGITAQIQAEESRADQAFKTAESQWKRQLTSDVIGGVASVASAGITQAGQLNEAKLLAERAGYFGGAEDVQKMIDQGWTPQMLQQETARVDQQVNTLLGSGVELSDIHMELGLGAGYTGAASSIEPSVDQLATTEKGAMEAVGMADSGTSSNAIVDSVETEMTKKEEKRIKAENEKVFASQAEKEKAKKEKSDALFAQETPEIERKAQAYQKMIDENKARAEKGEQIGDKLIEEQQLAETQRLIAEDKEMDRRRETTKEVLVEGAGKAAYKQTYARLKAEKDAARQKGRVPKTEKEESYAVQSFEDQPDYGVTVEALAPAKKGKKYKIERKGKEHSVIVTNVDKENEKVTLRDTVLNKEYKTSFDKFDEYRGGVTNMASKEIEPIFSTVQKFEKGSRAERHNNLGAVVWSPNLQKKYPEMEKGDSFVDKDGVTRYTAKFPNKETGDKINKQIMQDMLESVDGDTARFYARWSGLPIDSDTVQNFVKEVGG